MPNTRISNSIPNMGIRNSIPNARVSTFQTQQGGYQLLKGTPIGLLLSLTYSQTFSPNLGDYRPSMRIKSD